MGKNNNLKDFVTDIADAIREKKGTTELINPQDFSDEIRGIDSGNILQETMIDRTGKGLHNTTTIIITEGVEVIESYFATQYSKITNVYIPKTLKRIKTMAFSTVNSLLYVSPFPPGFEAIETQAFQYCTKIPFLDFTNAISIPTLASVYAFTNTICKFIVPDNLYDEWVVATNWSTFVDRIVKASEYVEPTNN